MAYYHKVKVVRSTGAVTKAFGPVSMSTFGELDAFIRKAITWPKTLRIEVEEEDTQLYGYRADQRHYPRAVFLKDGRAYAYHGLHGNCAWLHDGPMHTLRLAS